MIGLESTLKNHPKKKKKSYTTMKRSERPKGLPKERLEKRRKG
jgi:hypothetical protein